jgi:leader peptidase (prepilin peptidase)/N-methyltransferase
MLGRDFYTAAMSFVLALLLGMVSGLLLGSFLNVWIVRVPLDQSVVRPGSHCRGCGHAVRWFDNLPIVSWIVLRGRCRDCGARIALVYPAVELATGLWFAYLGGLLWRVCQSYGIGAAGLHATFDQSAFASINVISAGVLGFLMIGLIVIDWQIQRLPDLFTLGGIAAAFFLMCVQAVFLGSTEDQITLNSTHQFRLSSPGSSAATGNIFVTGPENLIFGRVAAVCGAALLLLLVRWGYRALRKRDGLGLGDVKMLAMIAAFLGFWPAMLTLFVGVLLASVYGTALLLRGRANALTRLPLGSFLGIAGLASAVVGQRIFAWYFSQF